MSNTKLNISVRDLKIFKADQFEYEHIDNYDSARTDKVREVEFKKIVNLNKKNELQKKLFFPKQSKIVIDQTNRYYDTLYAETNEKELNSEMIGGTYEYLLRRDIYIE